MQNPSLHSYIAGIISGVIISLIFIGLPIYSAIKTSCKIVQSHCSANYLFSAIFSSFEFLIATIIIIIVCIFLSDYFFKIRHARKA